MNLNKLLYWGLLSVYGPIVLFIICCGKLSNGVAKYILRYDNQDFIVLSTVFIALGIGWIWWSYKIVKWKYWAFAQVELADSHTLYRRAIQFGLIWPKGSIFNKTEIWTDEDKSKWSTLDPTIREYFE